MNVSGRTKHARIAEAGFTLIEIIITLVILGVVAITLAGIVYTTSRSKTSSMNNLESAQSGRIAMDMIARDLRNAGYGADLASSPGQTPIAYVDSRELILSANVNPYPDTSAIRGWPLAYNPSANPRPFPLNGTSWQPSMRYLTGAECVRWTLDLNNDGAVNASDIADANGIDAARTPNPGDYVLARQVYGDSTNAVANNNGGTLERVALVARPGGTTPALFTVYLGGSATPWDWTNGPVPSGQLKDITRVRVNVVSESPKPDWRQKYSRTEFKTDVNSVRNVPVLSGSMYDVDGYAFNDLDGDQIRDAGEPGLAGVALRLGMFTATSDATGYFYFNVPQGSYTLREYPPAGFTVSTTPDTFLVTVGPDANKTFANARQPGGYITCFSFEDLDKDGVFDTGEPPVSGAKFENTPTNQVVYSDPTGKGTLFSPVGTYTVGCTPPDSFVVMSTNPVSGSIANGDSLSVSFALVRGGFGYVNGTVYIDTNRNGYLDGGEQGMANVWVGVTPDDGLTVPGYAYTNASGGFSIKTPVNDPPHTTPYSVICVPPAGFYPTSSMSISPLWVQDGATYSNNNFGMSSFQVITLNATRVLSLGSGDLIEKDWPGASTNLAHVDADLVLGADANGTDQVSVWFNQYNSTPLFNASPTYTRSAPQAVLGMAVDTLDGSSPRARLDLVTGTKLTASGNFFVWFNQNSSGNEGYLPTTYSASQNYKTSDNGDVQAVLTYDCAGGATADYPDIIVGTKSPSAGYGSIEVWKSNNAATPTFTREEIYPTAGGLLAGTLGEVTCMALGDFDGDGQRDLAVGTTTSTYSGQVLLFKYTNKSTLPHFTYMNTLTFASDAVTSLAAVDVNGDGIRDLVAGTLHTASSGRLLYLKNETPALFSFNWSQTVSAPGVVTAMVTADLGGTARSDLVVGYRQSTTSYAGGVRIYYLDSRKLPTSGTDPSGGSIVNMVPALTSNNFNFGANPSASPPFLMDVAAGVKSSATTGALVVFIR